VNISRSCWLTSSSARANKTHSSAIFELADADEHRALLEEGRLLLDHRSHVVEACRTQTRLTHCGNCQRYRHVARTCRAKAPICGLCAQRHRTREHPACAVCPKSTQAGCLHDMRKCANCEGPHPSGDDLCPVHLNEAAKVREANRPI
jgi:hypothetical protein